MNSELFTSLLYLVVGVLLAIFRDQALGWAMTIIGVLFIISGVLDLVKKNWTGGAVSLLIGVAIIYLVMVMFFTYLVGILERRLRNSER